MKVLRYTILLISVLLFVGCSNEEYAKNPTLGNLSGKQRQRLENIQASGIQVIKEGARMTFEIPVDKYVDTGSCKIKMSEDVVIDELADFTRDYLQSFKNATVYISGYSDQVWIEPTRNIVSFNQAKMLAEVFAEDGVDPDRMLVRGEGTKNAIASNQYPKGSRYNRRIEVVIQ